MMRCAHVVLLWIFTLVTGCAIEEASNIKNGIYSCSIDSLYLTEARKRTHKIELEVPLTTYLYIATCKDINTEFATLCEESISRNEEDIFSPSFAYTVPKNTIRPEKGYSSYQWGSLGFDGDNGLHINILMPEKIVHIMGTPSLLSLDTPMLTEKITHFQASGICQAL